MSARILDGKAIAASVRDALAGQARELSEQAGEQPTLAIVRAGYDPASESYARQIARVCEGTGMAAQVQALDTQISTEAFLDVVDELNHDRSVHGILLQEPYPETVDGGRVVAALDPRKDIDGVHPLNAGRLLTGLCTLDAKVALDDRFAVACDIDNPEGTHREAELAADALFFIDYDGVVSLMPMYRGGRTNRDTGGILAVPALDGDGEISRRLHCNHPLGPG